jgi:SAM-dependent methyltransferase
MDDASFIRYLASKKSVDDRSLNRLVWQAMISAVGSGKPRVLELGGGIGTMVERVIEDGRLDPASWTMIDSQPALIQEAEQRLGARVPFPVKLIPSSLDAYLGSGFDPFDLVVANAVLDLLDPPIALPRILRLAGPGGVFLFSVTFDGLTAMEPEIDAELDARVIGLYHRTMDDRMDAGKPSGDSRCGRHLLTLLPRCGYRIVEAGASDWIVYPREGGYPSDERFFLSCILDFFDESLSGHADMDRADLRRWLSIRREQLAAGELVYLAHQLDVLAAATTA